MQMLLFCHSGPDTWFDRPFDRLTVLSLAEGLTTLSEVEGESSAVSATCAPGCPRIAMRDKLLKSGMTIRI